jgi:recombination protein RecA
VNGSKEPKEKVLSLAVAQIKRQFGKGAIMRLAAQPTALDIAVISTGATPLDAALGVSVNAKPRRTGRAHVA